MSAVSRDNDDKLAMRWPRATDKIFAEAHPLRGGSVARATDERLFRMIRGFREAGDLLVDESLIQMHRASNLLFPMIFSYRQSLELHLKYFLVAYGPLINENAGFRGHGLSELFVQFKRIILCFDPTSGSPHEEELSSVEATIAELDGIDPGSDAFRFAHTRAGRPIDLPLHTIDLANLREVIAGIHNYLECVDWHLRYGFGVETCQH
jgi:hypothetical protein